MSATDELRKMLDERGVECDKLVGHPVVVGTAWHGRDGYLCTALEHAYDVPAWMLSVQACLTTAQAAEATLGRGTCRDEGDPSDFCCSECGARMFTDTGDTHTMIASDGRTIIEHPNYCPNCGRKVVE